MPTEYWIYQVTEKPINIILIRKQKIEIKYFSNFFSSLQISNTATQFWSPWLTAPQNTYT